MAVTLVLVIVKSCELVLRRRLPGQVQASIAASLIVYRGLARVRMIDPSRRIQIGVQSGDIALGQQIASARVEPQFVMDQCAAN